jgi:hypothetical protein
MALNTDELTAMLANAVAVALADGSLTSVEQSAIEALRIDLGLKKADSARAIRAAQAPDFIPVAVGRFSDNVRNLEDMLFLALVDGDLGAQESALVVSFARSIALTDDQIRALVPDAERRAKAARGALSCPSCGTALNQDARFCPSCGKALAANVTAAAEAADKPLPASGWVLEFAESTAANFPKALECARKATSFEAVLRNKKQWYVAGWPASGFSDMVATAAHLRGLRNRRVHLDGAELDWDRVFGFTWCAENREAAFRPALYCFGRDDNRINPWGCKLLGLEWSDWAEWLTYGTFEKSGPSGQQVSWCPDKDRIRHELESGLQRVSYCPHLRPELARLFLDGLPSRIPVTANGPWRYRQCREDQPGAIKVVEKKATGGFTFTDEYSAFGVSPRTPDVLRELVTVALSRAGVSDLTARDIVP